jgi:hypothetical protein
MTIEHSLHRKNLETAFLLASNWKPEDQAKLADAIADDFAKDDDALDHDENTCDCASCVSYMEDLLADRETEKRMERLRS